MWPSPTEKDLGSLREAWSCSPQTLQEKRLASALTEAGEGGLKAGSGGSQEAHRYVQ